MATKLGELISYQPNQALGLGSNASIPVSEGRPLEFTNQILRDIGAREFQKNILRYQQSIKDRDNMLEALSAGDIKVGDILERDMPVVRSVLDRQTEAYKEWMKKGYGNLDGAVAYKKATQAANEAVTQAQARKLYNDRENTLAAQEKIPKFSEARKKWVDNNLSNFWQDLVPFQETSRLNFAPIEKFAQPITQEFKDPKNEFYKGKRTFFSWGDTLRNAMEYSLTPEGLDNLGQLRQSFEEMSPVELADNVKQINKQLERYNKERGVLEGDQDYVTPIQVVQLPNKKLSVNEPMDKLAAKISLAGQPQFKTETLDLDDAALKIAKYKTDLANDRARIANDRNRLGLDWAKFNYGKEEDLFGASSVLNEAKDIIDKGIEQEVYNRVTGKNEKSLRIGDPTLLQRFGNIDKDGNITNVPSFLEYDKNKDQVVLGYYGGDGRTIEKTVSMDQRTWLKEIARRSFPNKDIGKVNAIIDDVLTKSGNSLYKITQRTGGAANTINVADVPAGTKLEKKGGKYYYQGKEVVQ